MRDRFPHPYTLAHAEGWVAMAPAADPETQFAIEVNGEAVGGIGLFLQEDVERYSAEIGYWLGEAYWGQGITTAAVRRFTDCAFDRFGLCRIYANVFASNPGSCRVLERAATSSRAVCARRASRTGRSWTGCCTRRCGSFRADRQERGVSAAPAGTCKSSTRHPSPDLPGHGHCPIVRSSPLQPRSQ